MESRNPAYQVTEPSRRSVRRLHLGGAGLDRRRVRFPALSGCPRIETLPRLAVSWCGDRDFGPCGANSEDHRGCSSGHLEFASGIVRSRGPDHDVFAFTMLQEIMARSLGVEVGTYKHAVGSLHLYEDDRQKAQQFDSRGLQADPVDKYDCRRFCAAGADHRRSRRPPQDIALGGTPAVSAPGFFRRTVVRKEPDRQFSRCPARIALTAGRASW